jgi:hypothetical protein
VYEDLIVEHGGAEGAAAAFARDASDAERRALIERLHRAS